jgi:hypothetical protein
MAEHRHPVSLPTELRERERSYGSRAREGGEDRDTSVKSLVKKSPRVGGGPWSFIGHGNNSLAVALVGR